jgi:C1A family cysteine protease
MRHHILDDWIPQDFDHRDFPMEIRCGTATLPEVKPLTMSIPAWDQGDLGACTGHGCGRVWAHRIMTEFSRFVMPSRLFIYYGERSIESTIKQDSGAQVRDGMKAMAKWGVPPEADWPYDIAKFAKKPPATAYTDALKDVALVYQAVPCNLAAIKQALSAGNPIVGGFDVCESFESAKVARTGIVPMPKKGEVEVGGHCVCIDGYTRDGYLWCANSWGPDWGIGGWFKMPVAMLEYWSDLWVLTRVA